MGICKFSKNNINYHDPPEPEKEPYDLTYDLKQGNVVMYIEPNCKKCEKTQETLKSVNIRPVLLDVSLSTNPKGLRKALKSSTGSTSFPYVFVVRSYYGGLAEVEKGVANHTIQKLINSNLERIGRNLAF